MAAAHELCRRQLCRGMGPMGLRAEQGRVEVNEGLAMLLETYPPAYNIKVKLDNFFGLTLS